MKHELWKFWSVKTIFLLHVKLVPYSLTSPYGHLSITDSLFGPRKCQKSYIPYLCNTDTFIVKRTLGSVPLVSILKKFDCT